jgi:predicted nucleotidyltransferase
MTTSDILSECKRILGASYGPTLREIILYGSVARGDDTVGSDIDLLVVLEDGFDFFVQQKRVLNLLYDLELDCERVISALPVPQTDYETGRISLYRVARREGVVV